MCAATKALYTLSLAPSLSFFPFLDRVFPPLVLPSFGTVPIELPRASLRPATENSNLTYLHISGDGGELPYLRVYTYI